MTRKEIDYDVFCAHAALSGIKVWKRTGQKNYRISKHDVYRLQWILGKLQGILTREEDKE